MHNSQPSEGGQCVKCSRPVDVTAADSAGDWPEGHGLGGTWCRTCLEFEMAIVLLREIPAPAYDALTPAQVLDEFCNCRRMASAGLRGLSWTRQAVERVAERERVAAGAAQTAFEPAAAGRRQ